MKTRSIINFTILTEVILFLLLHNIAFATNDEEISSAEDHYLQGFSYFEQNKLNEALKEFGKVIEKNPDHTNALFFKAVVLGRMEKYEKSVVAYDDFLKYNPDDAVGWSNRATSLCHIGHWNKALQSIEKALNIAPQDHTYLFNKGMLLYSIGKFEQGLHTMKEAKNKGYKITEQQLTIYEEVTRQFRYLDLPPIDWLPNYDNYYNIFELSKNDEVIPFGIGIGTSISFTGSVEKPLEFLHFLKVWDGSFINDRKHGLLLSNGTKFKQTRLENGSKVHVLGHIENWKAQVDTKQTLQRESYEEKSNNESKSLIWFVIVSIVVIIIGTIIFLIFKKHTDKSN